MFDEKQFEQLMLQYNQLYSGSVNIEQLILKEDFDSAITAIKSREGIFRNCQAMLRYLELTADQQKQFNEIYSKLQAQEEKNIATLKKGLDEVTMELKGNKGSQKLFNAYAGAKKETGGIINYKDG